jgi:GNAT superfamily N-acetyltransferase
VPSIREYEQLCEAVGWADDMNLRAAACSLPRSLYCVVAMAGDRVVGMGRVVGDGAMYFYIQDVAVVPEHRGRGVGSEIVRRLTVWVRESAPRRAFIGLFATKAARGIYERHGFATHPALTGMFTVAPGALGEP